MSPLNPPFLPVLLPPLSSSSAQPTPMPRAWKLCDHTLHPTSHTLRPTPYPLPCAPRSTPADRDPPHAARRRAASSGPRPRRASRSSSPTHPRAARASKARPTAGTSVSVRAPLGPRAVSSSRILNAGCGGAHAGAGFYVNATAPKWAKHYNMLTHVTIELPQVLEAAGLPLVRPPRLLFSPPQLRSTHLPLPVPPLISPPHRK